MWLNYRPDGFNEVRFKRWVGNFLHLMLASSDDAEPWPKLQGVEQGHVTALSTSPFPLLQERHTLPSQGMLVCTSYANVLLLTLIIMAFQKIRTY